MLRRTRLFGLVLVVAMLLAACEQFGWQRIPSAEDPVPAPAIRWTAPAIGAALSGSVTFRVEPVGGAEFDQVDFAINDVVIDTTANGVLTFNVDFLNLPPGPVQATAIATNAEGVIRTAQRAFAVVAPGKPMVEWVHPLALRDYAPYEFIDLTVQVADASRHHHPPYLYDRRQRRAHQDQPDRCRHDAQRDLPLEPPASTSRLTAK
jgi:hypothetical protein